MSRVATEWLQENTSDIRHFHRPSKSKSPDKNISGMPCSVLFRRYLHQLSLLWIYGLFCCELPPRYHQTSVESMPHCVAALLHVRGGPTRY
ncbi:hypothetical protein AVEN_139312-1 [Araneus ventricosus]|uniref:Uncharacterized protein n=1 Tax=Araneus ventricosus TaxID=182803 RepID=A0A4Y2QSL4_ARAVE|nr:hypothetical protein AVEN_139312-1 [Araneus ventricosus]